MLWTVCQIFSGCNFLLIDYLRELMGGDGRDGTTLYIYASISYLYSFDCLFVCVCRDLSNNNLRLGNHSFSSWIHLRELWVLVLCLGRKENRKIIGFYLYPAVCNGALYLPLFHCQNAGTQLHPVHRGDDVLESQFSHLFVSCSFQPLML